MSFHGHRCPSIMIIRIFCFLSDWDGAPLRFGALRKLRTLRIGSGGTGNTSELLLRHKCWF